METISITSSKKKGHDGFHLCYMSTGIPELDEAEGELDEKLSSQRCREIRKLEFIAQDIVVGASDRIKKKRRTDRRRQRRFRV